MPSPVACAPEPREVALTTAAAEALTAATDATWPHEMVLLLAGAAEADRVLVARCLDLCGATGDRDGFRVPAAAFARAEAAARAAGLQWLGFAHSHPNGAAALSPTDRRELWHDCVQIVVGGPRHALRTCAFVLRGDAVRELLLTLVPDAAEATR
jgi:proteasome lid subunit RPN8/RPN11